MENILTKNSGVLSKKLKKESNIEEVCRIYQQLHKCTQCPFKEEKDTCN